LSYRLHVLKGSTPVSWSALKAQFGVGFESAFHFRATFKDNLRLALAVYRDAKVDVTDRGVDLHPAPPPIAPRFVTIGRVPGISRGRGTILSGKQIATLCPDVVVPLVPQHR
ncbi:MAG: hypothetical protein ACJ8AW_38455, partial [Rhodopila sp.]